MNTIPDWLAAAAHAGGSEGLEKTRLTLGFMPLTDCAPLAVALEKGYFRKYGLDVTLSREVSWANIRDKVMAGVLDGAHMLASMPIATALGLGEVRRPTITALSLDLNGNAITVSPELYRRMQEADPAALAERPPSARALARVIEADRAAGREPLFFATVFPCSTHEYLLRYWLASAGIHPDRDVRLVVIPPPYMVEALRSGDIDGYCVGEPWNEQAVALGLGRCLVTDCEIWNNKPEKVFGVDQEWAERHPNTHKALLMALLEVAQWIDRPENRMEVVEILAREDYVNAPQDVVKMSMIGSFRYALDQDPVPLPDFNVFYRHAATFPWRSHAVWFLTQMLRWGQLREPLNILEVAEQVYRPDLYREAARELGLPYPTVDGKPEGQHSVPHILEQATAPLLLGPDRFVDGRVFDPQDPLGYLAGFECHALKISLDEWTRWNP
jgi:ABC-type nitrate/sulfonate/bicarbonate transport system substrate-binding protein